MAVTILMGFIQFSAARTNNSGSLIDDWCSGYYGELL